MSYVVLVPLNFDPHPPRKTVRRSAENKYPLPSLGKENNIPGPPTAHNTKLLQDPARSACQPQAYPVLARLATMVGRTVSCQWCDDPCLRSLILGRSPHCCPRSSDSVRRPSNSESCSMFHACRAVSLQYVSLRYILAID